MGLWGEGEPGASPPLAGLALGRGEGARDVLCLRGAGPCEVLPQPGRPAFLRSGARSRWAH